MHFSGYICLLDRRYMAKYKEAYEFHFTMTHFVFLSTLSWPSVLFIPKFFVTAGIMSHKHPLSALSTCTTNYMTS